MPGLMPELQRAQRPWRRESAFVLAGAVRAGAQRPRSRPSPRPSGQATPPRRVGARAATATVTSTSTRWLAPSALDMLKYVELTTNQPHSMKSVCNSTGYL